MTLDFRTVWISDAHLGSRGCRAADVFVFPSRTDTFGVVMLEANACGLPVAAYPVTGPIDVVRPGVTGVLSEDLGEACRAALKLDRRACRDHAMTCSWRRTAMMALDTFVSTKRRRDVSAPSLTPHASTYEQPRGATE